MAKKNQVTIDILVNGKMQKATVSANALKKALDGVHKSNEKASKSAGTYDRNTKGAARASANATKNFSKMAQGGGGIAAMYAQIAAQVFAVSAAFQFLKSAADTSKLIKGQEALGAVTGTAFKSMTASIQEATGGQLAYAEAAQAAAIGTAAGLTSSQLEGLGKAARNASAALGRDLTDSFNRLVRGVTKAEPELLDELGIILRLKDATEEYALAVGKNVNELSTYERSQAVTNNVLGQAEDKFGKIAKIMDPSAESLNRFLTSFDELLIQIKTGVIDNLRPVFDFLSNNTNALVIAFGALAAIIVKSLIPDFGAYAKAANAAGFTVRRQLVAQRKELEAIAEAARVAALSQKELAAESVTALTKATGIAGKEGGRGAMDFLSGMSDSKASQTNAKKALDHYHNQTEELLKGSIDRRTGMLAKYTEDQVAFMDTAYNHRMASLHKTDEAVEASTAAQTGSIKKLWLVAKLETTKFGAWLLKWGARTAGLLQTVLIVGAFAGAFMAIASILYDVGKAIVNFFFPISESSKKASKDVQDLTKKLSGLNDEMSKMVQVRNEVGLTLTEMITQSGGAASSADLAARAIALQKASVALGKGQITSDEYKALNKEFKDLLDVTSKLLPGLAATQQAFIASGNAADINIDGLNGITQSAISAGQALKELGRGQQQFQNQMRQFTGGKVDPLIGLISTQRRNMINASNVVAAGAIQQENEDINRGELKRGLEAERRELRNDLAGARNQPKKQQIRESIAAIDAQLERLSKQKELREDEIARLTEQANKERDMLEALESVQGEYNAKRDQAVDIQKRLAKEKRIEFDIDDKINNLQLDREGASVKVLQLEAQRVIQAKMVEESKGDEKKTQQEILNQLDETLEIERGKKRLSEDQIDLQLRIANIQKDHNIDQLRVKENLLSLEAQALGMLEKQAAAEKTINDLRLQRVQREMVEAPMRREAQESPLPGFVFNEEEKRAKLQIEADREMNRLKMEQIERDKKIAEAKLKMEEAQFKIAQQRLRMELAVLNEKNNEEYVIPAGPNAGLTPDQAGFMTTIDSQASTAFSEQGNAITATFEAARDAILESNAALDLQEAKLSDIGQISQAVGSTLESSMTQAFTSIITGTSSVKDAFKNMAVAVLQALAQILAKMMMVKLIGGMIGMGGGGGGANPTPYSSIDEFFRYGGITKGPEGYSTGGVAKGPQSGYPVMMHGTEAIVPLPNGKSIPVEMKGGAGQQNNVTVNVAVDNNGQASTTTEGDTQGMDIGKAIAGAVQKELQNQKRAGGILSPYGVA